MRGRAANTLAEQPGNDGCKERRQYDCEMNSVHAAAFHGVQLADIDRAPVAEQDNENRKPDRRLGRRNGENEEDEYLSRLVSQVAREGNEVEIDREQHQLDTHQQKNEVSSVDKNSGNGERKQHGRYGQIVMQADHCFSSACICTRRTRSLLRVATCRLISWTFSPGRLRIVSVIAATIASSRMTAAISNA